MIRFMEVFYTGQFVFMILLLVVGMFFILVLAKKIFWSSQFNQLLTARRSPTFYECLSEADKDWIEAEERYLKTTFGVSRIPEASLQKMRRARQASKVL